MTAQLSVLSGPFAGSVVDFSSSKYLVGREEDCDLRPDSRLISRHHCVFLNDGFTVRVRDLGSRNGTFVNGTRIHGAVLLNDGDVISIGEMTLRAALSSMPVRDVEKKDASMSGTAVFDGDTLNGAINAAKQTEADHAANE